MGKFFDSFNTNIAIDLGTSNTRIFYNDKGVVLKEPTVVALDRTSSPVKVIEAGFAAQKLLGRQKGQIKTASPLKYGVIAELELAIPMLKNFINRVLGHRLIRFAPKVVIGIPGGATGVEKNAAYSALESIGAKKTALIEQPIAAAIGANIDIQERNAAMIVDMGGGSTDIAIISYGDVLINNTLRVAGEDFNKSILKYIKAKKKILVGEKTVESLKVNFANLSTSNTNEEVEITGVKLTDKSPVKVTITTSELREALLPPITYIAKEIRQTIETAPPEVIAELADRGIVLTGGSAMLKGIVEFIQKEVKVPVHLAPEPLLSVVIGADRIQNDPQYQRLLLKKT